MGFNPYNNTPNNWGFNQPQTQFGQQNGQMMQQSVSQAPFVGRYVNDISDIMPNEVPMDGRVGIFPTKDLNTIYLKCWNAEGRIITFPYILDQSQNLNAEQSQTDLTQSDILKRLDQLEKQISTNSKKTNQRNSSKGEE